MGPAFEEAPKVEEDDGGDLERAVPVFLPLCPPAPLYRTAGDAAQPFMWTCGRNNREMFTLSSSKDRLKCVGANSRSNFAFSVKLQW